MIKRIIVLCLIIMLAGCSASTFKYNNEDLKSNIENIEIVDDVNKEFIENDIYKVEYDVLTSIDESDKIKDFIYDLSKLEFKQLYGDPERQLKGRCIILTYKNGDYEIICQRKMEKYNKDSQQINIRSNYCDLDEFNEFLEKYLNN